MRPLVIRSLLLARRSIRAKSARVGVPIPEALASVVRNASYLSAVMSHDVAQRRVGFERRRVDADHLALTKSTLRN
jgi:hypothetical protein